MIVQQKIYRTHRWNWHTPALQTLLLIPIVRRQLSLEDCFDISQIDTSEHSLQKKNPDGYIYIYTIPLDIF